MYNLYSSHNFPWLLCYYPLHALNNLKGNNKKIWAKNCRNLKFLPYAYYVPNAHRWIFFHWKYVKRDDYFEIYLNSISIGYHPSSCIFHETLLLDVMAHITVNIYLARAKRPSYLIDHLLKEIIFWNRPPLHEEGVYFKSFSSIHTFMSSLDELAQKKEIYFGMFHWDWVTFCERFCSLKAQNLVLKLALVNTQTAVYSSAYVLQKDRD